jgi:dihydroorotase
MTNLGYKVIDLHTHLRDNIPFHTRLAKEAGIGMVLYMANTKPCLDNIADIETSLKKKRFVKATPVSAITIGRKGKKLVDIESIKPYVAGFSDDGDCLKDLKLFAEALKKNVLLMVHSEPETEMVEKYLRILEKIGGRLHLQHVVSASTIKIIRKYKKRGLKFTAETCPHYFTYPNEVEDKPIYPPLGTLKDITTIKEALADGTIDCIASDYAPVPRPRGTGFASFASFIPLCYGLVLEKALTPKQLKEKIHDNPLKIIKSGEFFLSKT